MEECMKEEATEAKMYVAPHFVTNYLVKNDVRPLKKVASFNFESGVDSVISLSFSGLQNFQRPSTTVVSVIIIVIL